MQECNQCGKCCTKYGGGGLSATKLEVQWWDRTRPDIYAYVRHGNIWMDPVSGKQLEMCPWLRIQPGSNLYTCAIYYDRPEDCKFYPVTIEQMMNDDCEMLQARDLANLKHAQRTLDKIMANSRPSYKQED